MQPPSACACRGCIPWQGILLAVSLLTFWSPHPTAQLTIQPVPVDAAEGTDVLLLVHHASANVVGYTWYKGNITDSRHRIVSYSILTQTATTGTAFSGRETIYPNGSLLFVNVTQEDTGFYTLQTTRNDFSNEVATGEFHVYEEKTSGLSVGAIAGIVTGVLVGVALVAALGCFLLHTRTGRTSVQHGHRGRHTPASTPGSLAHWTTQKHRVSPRTCCLTKHLKTEDPRHLLQQGPSPPHTLLNSCLCPQAKVPLMASPPWPLSLVTAMLFPSTSWSRSVPCDPPLDRCLVLWVPEHLPPPHANFRSMTVSQL
ncbi:carcinoembryonic antigen-related cell adhesion molecule 3-like isoform X7 [Sciurus carolinensis]|uniref:carcinoembryonic antigen-related cell adhesion molecule 3-like isoform X7 n=1 Tax=Sciurus carolinensis TaxID=30640 RepID=UPI001FB3EFA2|nr:carcinoembryonic antigen-related cell adhesion molecule 3-like isoform X7 [Sciurus carolinensis]